MTAAFVLTALVAAVAIFSAVTRVRFCSCARPPMLKAADIERVTESIDAAFPAQIVSRLLAIELLSRLNGRPDEVEMRVSMLSMALMEPAESADVQ